MSAVLKSYATKTDIVPYSDEYMAEVLSLAREMKSESIAHRDMALDERKLVAQLRESFENPDVYVRLAVRGHEVLGAFFGVVTNVYFSAEKVAKDMAWFVRKNRRGSFAAVLLLSDFEEWAQGRGVRKVFLGQSSGVEMDATAILYQRLGYVVVGVNCVKAIGE